MKTRSTVIEKLVIILAIAGIAAFLKNAPMQAQPQPETSPASTLPTPERDRIIFTPRPEAKDDDESRGPVNPPPPYGESLCPIAKIPLTAIAPNKDGNTNIILTAQTHPSLWFYNPYESQLTGEFSISQQGKQIYQQTLQLSGKAGLIGITLPTALPGLSLNEEYNWNLTLICNPQDRAEDLYVGGSIKRVNSTPNFTPQLTAMPQDKAKLYALDGLLPETLTTIVRDLSPKDKATAQLYWTQVMQELGLEKLSEESPAEQETKPL
ncbi:DUF928 domain-containing protein [Oscillatoria sp. FACHB-1406]|uniref:DUF928 domain-containing protein n=1 Tax=Oscillatoria sp. FACHB-1406 TaxID=2692846 RepID=UPI0016857638|nr:DUF928 domain-containing protein [Oscillatoria sp. FACHB-1406]MBD2578369.1 DUF928 domain-containing protein [Oscillatoria sp. FACHB-1406]